MLERNASLRHTRRNAETQRRGEREGEGRKGTKDAKRKFSLSLATQRHPQILDQFGLAAAADRLHWRLSCGVMWSAIGVTLNQRIAEDLPSFLRWLKVETEKAWETHVEPTLEDYKRRRVGGSDWRRGTKWLPGLTDSEIDRIEEQWSLEFPSD